MSISYRRYEILLPRRFNDGRPVRSQQIEIWLTSSLIDVL